VWILAHKIRQALGADADGIVEIDVRLALLHPVSRVWKGRWQRQS
jgi:hypothetical protein